MDNHVADDNSSKNGTYNAMIDGDMYRVTKVNGVYTEFVSISDFALSGTYTLTPPAQ